MYFIALISRAILKVLQYFHESWNQSRKLLCYSNVQVYDLTMDFYLNNNSIIGERNQFEILY